MAAKVFERERNSSPFLNLGGLVLQGRDVMWLQSQAIKGPPAFILLAGTFHSRILSYNTRGQLPGCCRGRPCRLPGLPVLLSPSLPAFPAKWRTILEVDLQLQLAPAFSHLRHCWAEKSHASSQFLTAQHNVVVVYATKYWWFVRQ